MTMTRWSLIGLMVWLCCGLVAAWAHEGHSHVMGTVKQATSQQIVVTTPKGDNVTITLQTQTIFEKNGITTPDNRPNVGDRLVADVSRKGDQLIAKSVRFATPKPK